MWSWIIDKLKEAGSAPVILLGIVYLFHKLVWSVWSSMIKSKDEEIQRLVQERDKYQAMVFSGFQSSNQKHKEK